ncbi:lipid kinase YegS [Ferrimonas marina]|uniref:Lipid kinase YegS n=1 Tax=Ferrimonas marina TaxID=299255 RepID=A0A1M5RIU1_9GAMM|nr:lipid kinase YegS [Ferrimonas marina]SHH26100.1 lipid kinase YegS [Ferrimonas marina]
MTTIRVLLNGKKAGLASVREGITAARRHGAVEVRTSFEGGDVARQVREAVKDGCTRLVAGGGDGTVNEAVDALMQIDPLHRPELAILPLGTANDFASAAEVPLDTYAALVLAQQGRAVAVDVVAANEHHFINVASGGFGAQITATTPVALKNFLGGGAYTLTGLVQAVGFTPYQGALRLPDGDLAGEVVVGAACNGRQAGGGQKLAPAAYINDGLMDLVALLHFPPEAMAQVMQEILAEEGGEYVKRLRAPWAEWHCEQVMPINLDGEPIEQARVRLEVRPGALKMVLPQACPLLKPDA